MKTKYTIILLLLPYVSAMCIIMGYPMLEVFRLSFFSYKLTTGTSSWTGLSNYMAMFDDYRFWNSAYLVLYLVISTVTLQVLFGLGIAMLFSGAVTRAGSFRGQRVLRSLAILPMVTTPVIVGIIWRNFMFEPMWGMANYFIGLVGIKPIHWIHSYELAMPSYIIVHTWQWTPFAFLILFAGLQALPKEPFEAAQIDGAGRWHTFRHLTLPLMKPVIMLTIILRTIEAMKAFPSLYSLTEGGPGIATETLNLYIYYVAFTSYDLGYASALGVVFTVIIAFSTYLLLKVGAR